MLTTGGNKFSKALRDLDEINNLVDPGGVKPKIANFNKLIKPDDRVK